LTSDTNNLTQETTKNKKSLTNKEISYFFKIDQGAFNKNYHCCPIKKEAKLMAS
jgi:hypothetical protein